MTTVGSRGLAVLAIAALLGSPACAAHRDADTAQAAAPAAAAPTAAETQYGVAPTRNANVTYRPDVIIPEGGAKAVRSVSADGLTWTIDATAPHAAELVAGKIMFVTGRGVGRVLGTTRKGDDLAVTLGPVALTDVIQEAHLSGDQPLDMGAMTAYVAPDYPEPKAGDEVARTPYQRIAQAAVASSTRTEFGPPALQLAQALQPGPMPGPPTEVNVTDFVVNPFCCGGLGIKVSHDGPDVKVSSSIVLYLDHPSVSWDLNITTQGVETAKFQLRGATGLRLQFQAGSELAGVTGNISRSFLVPVDLSFPILGAAVPIALTVHQSFVIRSLFTAKNSTVTATGDYGFSGAIGMECHYSTCTGSAPMELVVKQSMLDSMDGKSGGVNGLVLGYEGRVIVGIGAFGFVTGPYVGYDAFLGITRGSDLSDFVTTPCRKADLYTSLHVGVGYSMPQAVTKAINFILRTLNYQEIKSFDGTELRKPIKELHDQRGCGAGAPAGPAAPT